MIGIVLLAGGISTGLLVGGLFGARHAFEADHVAAVATLVEDDQRPVTTGVAWGIGHSLPILALGAVFLALDLRVPTEIAMGFELIVAVILIALGLRVLAGREALGITILRHIHRSDGEHQSTDHLHFTIGGKQIGLKHSHADEESVAVGIVHGLAGSGGVVVALAAAAPTVARGVAFLVGFSAASVVAMGIASWVWGRAVGHTRLLRIAAGVASIAVGLLLLAEIAGVAVRL